MAVISIASGASNSGLLAADTLYAIETGMVELSTDAGTTWIEFYPREKVIFSSGLTVAYRNSRTETAILKTMAV